MTKIKDENIISNKENISETVKKSCFIVMPISDVEGYPKGHFKRVYDHIIKPACEKSGYKPIRADDVASSNYIIIDILSKIIDSDLVICDLSAKNPNVMYELGIRHAFNLPTVLIKDNKTSGIFDIQGLRYIEYSESLRIDCVQSEIDNISSSINETIKKKKDVNSIIELLGIKKPAHIDTKTLSPETTLIMETLKQLSHKVNHIEVKRNPWGYEETESKDKFKVGDTVYFDNLEIATVKSYDGRFLTINKDNKLLKYHKDSPQYKELKLLPF